MKRLRNSVFEICKKITSLPGKLYARRWPIFAFCSVAFLICSIIGLFLVKLYLLGVLAVGAIIAILLLLNADPMGDDCRSPIYWD